MSTFQLLYPESRVVSVEWVLTQGCDAKVNAAVDEHVRQHGVFAEDGSYEAFVAGIAAPDVAESIELLEDLGLATFARWCEADDEPNLDELPDDDDDEDTGQYAGGYRTFRDGSAREDFRSDC